MELIILPEIQRRLMPLQPEELAELERSVLEEGIRDPLVVWRKDGQLILVDGHHRYELAKKHGLSFQIVEREFRDLDEVLIWVDRNQLGRRNLTDEQRAFIMHRLYGSVKLAPHRPTKEENALNLSAFLGRDATAKKIASMTGVSAATVKRAHQFGKVVEALQEVSPQAAERVLRGEVRDALTALPKVPSEALSFVASANFQRRPANRAGSLSLVALPTDWRCSRPKTLTNRNKRRALQALNNNCWNLLAPSRAQSPHLPQQSHSLGASAPNLVQVIQPSPKEC